MNKLILKSETTKTEIIFDIKKFRLIRLNLYGEPIKINKAYRTTIIKSNNILLSTTWSFPTLNGYMTFDSPTASLLEREYILMKRMKKINNLTNA